MGGNSVAHTIDHIFIIALGGGLNVHLLKLRTLGIGKITGFDILWRSSLLLFGIRNYIGLLGLLETQNPMQHADNITYLVGAVHPHHHSRPSHGLNSGIGLAAASSANFCGFQIG